MTSALIVAFVLVSVFIAGLAVGVWLSRRFIKLNVILDKELYAKLEVTRVMSWADSKNLILMPKAGTDPKYKAKHGSH